MYLYNPDKEKLQKTCVHVWHGPFIHIERCKVCKRCFLLDYDVLNRKQLKKIVVRNYTAMMEESVKNQLGLKS